MSHANKTRKRRAMRQVAAVQGILRRWDPIGQGPQDEYDGYAPHIVSMLVTGSDEYQRREHLQNLRTVAIGLGPNSKSDARFAKELADWWREHGQE